MKSSPGSWSVRGWLCLGLLVVVLGPIGCGGDEDSATDGGAPGAIDGGGQPGPEAGSDGAPSQDAPTKDGASTGDAAAQADARPDQNGAQDTAAATDTAPVNPICAGADSRGFFSSCASCPKAGDCDAISVNGSRRYACGCSSSADCPCGFRCGSYPIAPNINVSGICVK